MDRLRLTPRLFLAQLITGSVLRVLTWAGGPEPSTGPDHTVSKVTVVSNFDTAFTDCYRFDTPNPGDLTIDLPDTIIYRHGQLDAVRQHFKAVSLTEQGFSIMFVGGAVDALARLNGEAVNAFVNTFVFSGRAVKDYEAEPFEEFRTRATVYRRAP
jgi:hypothetical protein